MVSASRVITSVHVGSQMLLVSEGSGMDSMKRLIIVVNYVHIKHFVIGVNSETRKEKGLLYFSRTTDTQHKTNLFSKVG